MMEAVAVVVAAWCIVILLAVLVGYVVGRGR